MNTDANTGTTHSKNQKFFQPEDINRLEKSIDAAPIPARPMRTTDALTALAPALNRAKDKGHSLASLMQICEQQGLQVTERAIGRAINAMRAVKQSRKKPSATGKATSR